LQPRGQYGIIAPVCGRFEIVERRLPWKKATSKSWQRYPHEYVLKQDSPQEFSEFKWLIECYGVDEPFEIFGYVKTYRYLHAGDGYRYWIV